MRASWVAHSRWNAVLLSARLSGETEASPGTADSAPFAPLAMVPDPDAARVFEWRGDRAPRTPWRDTLIYELHVKGFTALNNAIPAHLRGTYLGVASEPSIDHLKATWCHGGRADAHPGAGG